MCLFIPININIKKVLTPDLVLFQRVINHVLFYILARKLVLCVLFELLSNIFVDCEVFKVKYFNLVFNRPGVAGAVLLSPPTPSLID